MCGAHHPTVPRLLHPRDRRGNSCLLDVSQSSTTFVCGFAASSRNSQEHLWCLLFSFECLLLLGLGSELGAGFRAGGRAVNLGCKRPLSKEQIETCHALSKRGRPKTVVCREMMLPAHALLKQAPSQGVIAASSSASGAKRAGCSSTAASSSRRRPAARSAASARPSAVSSSTHLHTPHPRRSAASAALVSL